MYVIVLPRMGWWNLPLCIRGWCLFADTARTRIISWSLLESYFCLLFIGFQPSAINAFPQVLCLANRLVSTINTIHFSEHTSHFVARCPTFFVVAAMYCSAGDNSVFKISIWDRDMCTVIDSKRARWKQMNRTDIFVDSLFIDREKFELRKISTKKTKNDRC